MQKNNHWYVSFTTNEKKITMPVIEDKNVRVFFPYSTKTRGNTINLSSFFEKALISFIAIPIQVISYLDFEKKYKSIKIDFKDTRLSVSI